MSTDRFERRLAELLTDLSMPQVPDYFDDILQQTARASQRPAWSFPERWIPMDISARLPVGTRTIPWVRVGVIALLIAALLATALLYVGSRPRPAPLFGPAANGDILYDRGGDIFVADPLGQNGRLLIGGGTDDFGQRYSADGLTIFFGRRTAEGTFVMAADADGSDIRQVSDTPLPAAYGSVEFSPDGTQLLVVDIDQGALEVRDLVGRVAPDVLELEGGVVAHEIAWWRPGTDEIVVRGYGAHGNTARGLYAIRADGSGFRMLTETAGGDGLYNQFVLSPDGSQAAYYNFEPDVVPGRGFNAHVVDLAAGQDVRLLFDRTAIDEGVPQFLPDDRVLLRADGPDGTASLVVGPADGSGLGTRIGPAFDREADVRWLVSPDGDSILLFVAGRPAKLISVATGGVVDTEIDDAPSSWQRRAP